MRLSAKKTTRQECTVAATPAPDLRCNQGFLRSAQGTLGLTPPIRPVLDSITEKAFVADRPHTRQRTTDASGKKCTVQTGQRRSFDAAEHVRCYGQIELIDEVVLQ